MYCLSAVYLMRLWLPLPSLWVARVILRDGVWCLYLHMNSCGDFSSQFSVPVGWLGHISSSEYWTLLTGSQFMASFIKRWVAKFHYWPSDRHPRRRLVVKTQGGGTVKFNNLTVISAWLFKNVLGVNNTVSVNVIYAFILFVDVVWWDGLGT